MVSSIDKSWVPLLEKLDFEMSGSFEETDAMKRDSASIFESLSSLTINLNDTSSNATLDAACAPELTELIVALAIGTTKKFALPDCLDSTALVRLNAPGLLPPDLLKLPTSVNFLWMPNLAAYGSGTFFNLNLLTRFTELETCNFATSRLFGPFPTNTTAQELHLGSNSLSGTIHPDFFVNSPRLKLLAASGNQLEGTIPWYGLANMENLNLDYNLGITHWPSIDTSAYALPRRFMFISLKGTSLREIPNSTFWDAQTSLFNLDLSNLPGLAGRTAPVTNPTQLVTLISYFLTGCGIVGPLPELLPTSTLTYSHRIWAMSFNQFSGSIPLSWSNYTFSVISLINNTGITGTLPPKLFGPGRREYVAVYAKGSQFNAFEISGTSITGDMTFSTDDYWPSYFGTTLTLRAARTNIDFCSNNATWDIQAYACDLSQTSAFSCPERYATPNCAISAPPPTLPPITTPIEAPSLPASEGCPGRAPAPEFMCINGTWTAPGSVTSPVVVIPPNASVIVEGNITSTSIIINGANSSITVYGCSNGVRNITIVLTKEDLIRIESSPDHSLSQELFILSGNGSCSNFSMSGLELSGNTKNGCRQVGVQQLRSSNGGLTALFTMTSSGCKNNTWWIILVSVLCGVVILGVIIAVVVLVLLKKHTATASHKSLKNSK